MWTFYGYFYDESQERWRLFAAGRMPQKPGRKDPDPTVGLVRRTGSFVEVPGAADTQRTGDAIRVVRRRGWFLDQDRSLHRAQMERPKYLVPGRDYTEEEIKTVVPKADTYTQRRSYYMEDFPEMGWMATQMGGIRRYSVAKEILGILTPPRSNGVEVPEYLKPEKISQLFELPYEIGKPEPRDAGEGRVTVHYPVKGDPAKRRATLYYGTRDSLTYPQQKVSGAHATPAIRDLFGPDRAWQSSVSPTKSLEDGYQFELSGLKPGTTYYCRIFLEGEAGNSWDFETHEFRTSHPVESSE